MKRTPWVVCADGGFVCRRCHERLVPPVPLRVEVFLAMTRAFVKCHADCAEGPVETVRSETGE